MSGAESIIRSLIAARRVFRILSEPTGAKNTLVVVRYNELVILPAGQPLIENQVPLTALPDIGAYTSITLTIVNPPTPAEVFRLFTAGKHLELTVCAINGQLSAQFEPRNEVRVGMTADDIPISISCDGQITVFGHNLSGMLFLSTGPEGLLNEMCQLVIYFR